MPRKTPNTLQNFLSSVVLPLLSLALLPISFGAIAICVAQQRLLGHQDEARRLELDEKRPTEQCVIISGGRMTKGLMLARAFKRAGWKVVGVDEEGWGEYCPMRFSNAVDSFHLLPSPTTSFKAYQSAICSLARTHGASLFIPVSGVASSVQDAMLSQELLQKTKGRCVAFIQDRETMENLHDKDRFMSLLRDLGIKTPTAARVTSVDEAIEFLGKSSKRTFVAKCLGIDENRGDLTLYPLNGDDANLSKTRVALGHLGSRISPENPYQLQEFVSGQEWCTHASVVDGQLTSFLACPSNDMLMTYEDGTSEPTGKRAEQWTRDLLDRLQAHPTASGQKRQLIGHFSFDFIVANEQLYPIECNARVHTAIILLPVDRIAACYSATASSVLRPSPRTTPRSWIYNDFVMRYLPRLVPSQVLEMIHPSLPACRVPQETTLRPSEEPLKWRVDPTLVADDWMPFLVLWHLYWPALLLTRWWQGRTWTRASNLPLNRSLLIIPQLNVSTGRIFEA